MMCLCVYDVFYTPTRHIIIHQSFIKDNYTNGNNREDIAKKKKKVLSTGSSPFVHFYHFQYLRGRSP